MAAATRAEPAYVPIVSVVLFLQFARGVAYTIGLVLIYRRDPRARKFYLWVLTGIMVIALLEALGRPMVDTVRSIGYCVI